MTIPALILTAALAAGHVAFGPRWIPDGTAGIVAAWARLLADVADRRRARKASSS